MADLLPVKIPLPLPRPLMEETVEGAKNAGIKLDIPFPEVAPVDLSFSLRGTDWLFHPFVITWDYILWIKSLLLYYGLSFWEWLSLLVYRILEL